MDGQDRGEAIVEVLTAKVFRSFLLSLLLLLTPPSLYGGDLLEVTFLDVGEGEAIYIETPRGDRILIDTGNPITGFRVAEFLRKRGVAFLTALFITHPHPDHMGGVFHILPAFKVGRIYDNGQPIPERPGCDIYRWYGEAVRGREGYRVVKRGDTFLYGNVVIEVLWPEGPLSSDWNENSLVLKLTYGKVSLLFMGDANKEVERALLERDDDVRADVLKVGHHGFNDATSKEFLKSVAPDFAVISINRENVRGYPHPEVLKRLDTYRVKTLITYAKGDVTFYTDGDRMILKEVVSPFPRP